MASGFYDITSKTLGKGHYGVVKLGRHCLTGEPVAIKIIEKSRLNKDSLHQLGTEIRILFRLSEYEHPNILKLYQTIDTEDRLFLVTEYCGPHACDLHDYLSRKHCRDGLSQREAQIFFVQICSAISYCHSMGIVHRDLKPENILVTDHKHKHTNPTMERGQVHEPPYPLLKLIDFGFANQWYPDEKMRTSCGTLAYSAPELLLGEPYDGTKVDVWGLGLMLYILLYGGNPFMQINDNETLTKILDCSFATPKRENVNMDAIELLRSLIKRNPDSRMTIDAIQKHKWFSALPKTIELMLNCPIKPEQSPCTKQPLPKLAPIVSPALPSISESGPLKNLNRSADDNHVSRTLSDISETTKPNYNRTRSLSITRTCSKVTSQNSLSQTLSSSSLERLNNQNIFNISPLPLKTPIYRPTSPDVGGFTVLTEEERNLHDLVVQEIFVLSKLIDSKSSIEASLKNARFAHRLFNQNSIQPAQLVKRKTTSGLVKSLCQGRSSPSETPGDTKATPKVDKLSTINNKLSNDDYIYATYQLTRDRILRNKQEQLRNQLRPEFASKDCSIEYQSLNNEDQAKNGETNELDDSSIGVYRVSAKENESSRAAQQRKLLQPQHKMRDKFTSFFRSGSTSPSGSFNVSSDSHGSGEVQSTLPIVNIPESQHEAFSDHNNETSGSSGRYIGIKTDSYENSMAYALPLARKCSLVSEESGCSNDLADNQ